MSTPEPPAPPEPEPPPPPVAAGERIDDGKGRIFPCEGCGADLVFHIGQQRLKCPYCGFEKDLTLDEDRVIEEQDFQAMLEVIRQRRLEQRARQEKEPQQKDASDVPDAHEVRCSACGATVLFQGTLISSDCPYCGSPLQRDDIRDAEQVIPFDGVLPFLIDRSTAKTRLRDWIRSRWFAPNAFRKLQIEATFEGVYLPYWTYDSLTFTRYVGERGEHYYVTVGSGKNRRTERRTRWYPAHGAFQRFFDDVLVPASTDLRRDYLDHLEPWPLDKCLPFTQEALAGFYARAYNVELDQGFLRAKERIDAALEHDVRQRIGGDEQRVHSIQTQYDAITFKLLLLPVWMLVYRFRAKPYQVLVNAGTGEVFGERPYSWIKIGLAIVAAAAAIAGIYFIARAAG